MPADRETSPVADVVFTAVSPALIMLMVGSLIFFLITVLPTGDYKERLLYTTFFFVFGAVLVARIAIQVDAARASVYGFGLGVVTFLAMSAYVEYPAGTTLRSLGWLVNIGFMALIWWSAHKLTWDCTHVDENRDASGRGLLAASSEPFTAEPVKLKKRKKKQSAFAYWTASWWAHHDAKKDKAHTPGVWVLYFSVAALPLFAIGQSLIPAEDDARRRAAFLQMAVYVGSGLGLLVTTSLLGLRRYLRQRKAKIPASLTAGWLGLGAILIAVFLVVGAFLPRPYSEVPWFGLPQAGKSDREASKYALLKDSAGKGDGADGDTQEFDKDAARTSSKGDKSSPGSKSGESKGGKSSPGSKSGESKGDKASPGSKSGENDNKNDDQKNGPNAKRGDGEEQQSDDNAKNSEAKDGDGKNSSKPPSTKLGAVAEKIGAFLKWIVIAAVVLLVIGGLIYGVLKYLAPFTAWARNLLDAIRNWWANLFGGQASVRSSPPVLDFARGPVRPPPFSDYSNPFADGSADRRDAAELTAYTFEALDAWAWDRGLGRTAAETPLEFAARLGVEHPELEKPFRKLASLFARTAYAFGSLPRETKPFLEAFWESLVHGVAVEA